MLLTKSILALWSIISLLSFVPTVSAGPPRAPVFYHRHKVGYKFSPFCQQAFNNAATRTENSLPHFQIITWKYFNGPANAPKPSELPEGPQEFLNDQHRFRKLWEQSLRDRKTMVDHIMLFNQSRTRDNGTMTDRNAITMANMVKELNFLKKKVKTVYLFAHQATDTTMWVVDKTFHKEAQKYIQKGDGPWWGEKLRTEAYILEQQLKGLQAVKKTQPTEYWDVLVELAVNRRRAAVFNDFQV